MTDDAKARIRDLRLARNAFWLSCQDDIHHYLMACTNSRLDGFMKATQHRRLCIFFLAMYLGIEQEDVVFKDPRFLRIHETTQELTGHLDRVIGFDPGLDPGSEALDELAAKFCREFWRLALQALEET